MTSDIRTKEDVEFRYDFGRQRPTVNVKVYGSIDRVELPLNLGGSAPADNPSDVTWHYTEPEFTHEWVEENCSEDILNARWEMACESGWEYIQMEAERIFDHDVKVWSEGRSGGWAVVDGLPDFDSWDAIMLGKWRSFARSCRAAADDVPRSILWYCYVNDFEPMLEERQRVRDAFDALDSVRDWREGVRLHGIATELLEDEDE